MPPPTENSSPRQDEAHEGLPKIAPDGIEEQHGDAFDDAIPTYGYLMPPMVGLGGSAGSLSALQAFFKAMPPDSGMTFVVILHLSPDHESAMPEILARCTSMPVMHPVDGGKAEPDTVYVIPPGKHLTCHNGKLQLTNLEPERGKRVAVDLFFRTLADTHGPHAIAIVLSGADGDGASGLKRIKERGGLTIAQDPADAEVSGMPQAAIQTGMVDWVLRAEEMPRWLLDYQARERRLRMPSETGPLPEPPQKSSQDNDEALLREVLAFLRSRTGRDFMCYKRATIVRRISRRMQINAVDDLAGYLAFLRLHPGEASALLQDLLISVTNFFRDREAFEALEQLIPQLFKGKGPGDAVRIWVPACATGEEAYSMAILALEHARTLDAPPAIQVFGCDLDDAAIQVARAGVYADTLTADVSEERLRRFFVKEHRGYHVRRELREIVLFASHDLLKDAPFSRMDLISCRNLLIYLSREAQERVLSIFHFALRPEGLLFLGTTESVPEDSPQFAVVDKKYRIYAHRAAQRAGLPVPAASTTLLRTLEASQKAQGSGPVLPERSFAQGFGALAAEVARTEEKLSLGELHFKLLERLAPPSMVVDRDCNVVHLSPHAGRYLQFAGGEPTTNLLRLVHPALRAELRTALFQAAESNVPVTVNAVPVEIEGSPHAVDIRVMPAPELAADYMLIVLGMREATPAEALQQPRPEEPEPVIRRLEREAEALKARLRDTVEQYEGSCEELKASNEELQAMNEELRSASEELETSREELQSINEELSTVNQELKSNLDELSHANSDMRNLMASTAIATLFLDREFRIMRFTPTAVSLFRLIPSDVGRPLADLNHQLDYPGLHADVQKVLDELVPIEREVCDTTPEARCYLARLLPYRTLDDHIGGVVLTLVDVTEVRRATEALEEELADTRQLQHISTQLIPEGNVEALYGQILDAALAVMRSDMASLQIFDAEKSHLHLLAHKGFHPRAAEFWKVVDSTSRSTCGMGISHMQRIIAPDVEVTPHPVGAEDLEHYRLCGIRGVQSTSLVCREGRLVGMISTHWRSPHVPGDRELRLLDVLARQAADLIERKRSEDELRASGARQAFLLKLGDELRGICCPEAIETTVLERTGQELQAEAVISCALDAEGGLSVTHQWRKDPAGPELECSSLCAPDLLAQLASGRTQVVAEAGAGAVLCVPLNARGGLTHVFAVAGSAGREWSSHEILLVEEVARRTWDAMERGRAAEALQGSEERYRTLFTSLDEGVLTVEVIFNEHGQACDQRYLEANPALVRMIGLPPDIIGKTGGEFPRGPDPFWLQTAGRVARSGESAVVEHALEARAGSWFEARCSRVGGEGSRTVVVIFNNITVRKQAELALRASEARQGLLLRLSDALRDEADCASIQFKAACVLGEHLGADRVGYAEPQEDGQSVVVTRSYSHGVNAVEGRYSWDNCAPRLRQFLGGDPVVRTDVANDPTLSAEEKKAYAEAQVGATVNVPLVKGGNLLAVLFVHFQQPHEWTPSELTIIRDVAERTWAATERARAEGRLAASLREVQAARQEAEVASQAKDHFLAVLSHELRTPLTPVLVAVELLEQSGELTPENLETLRVIQRNVELETQLIDDLLDVTRIARGKLEIAREEGDLHEALRHAVEICQPDFQQKRQNLELRLEAGRHWLRGDFVRLRQVFWNLLKNASKFTPEAGHVCLSTRNQHGGIVVEVADGGIGLDAETLERIFRPFEQGCADTTRRYGGLGLGLAISKAVAEAHGGVLSATSGGAGKGAVFSLFLPLAMEEPPPEQSENGR